MNYTDKIYGNFQLSKVFEDLINTSVFQRLKKIHQGGAIFLINPKMHQTRFEHSIGVMLLIQQLGGTEKEQIAGLLHDISHTAFSHLIDYVVENEEEDYHEKRFEAVLSDDELVKVLKKYGYDWRDFLDLEQFQLLEYPLPSLSADRIDYTLRDLFQMERLTKEEIKWFLGGLQVFENRIVLKSVEYGKWFQKQYTWLVTEYFNSKENKAINVLMKQIIKESLKEGIIEESDFWNDDFYLMEKLEKKVDIQKAVNELNVEETNTKHLKIKKRTINPEILINSQAIKLSELTEN